MDEKRPKRRKAKENPYPHAEIEGQHFLSVWDGQGISREITIDRELYKLMDRFERDSLLSQRSGQVL